MSQNGAGDRPGHPAHEIQEESSDSLVLTNGGKASSPAGVGSSVERLQDSIGGMA